MALRKRLMHITTDEVHWHGMERGGQSQPRLPNKADKGKVLDLEHEVASSRRSSDCSALAHVKSCLMSRGFDKRRRRE